MQEDSTVGWAKLKANYSGTWRPQQKGQEKQSLAKVVLKAREVKIVDQSTTRETKRSGAGALGTAP